jgi:anaerobic magnesium-protoporphyrin IX monomethyl ester cyclase
MKPAILVNPPVKVPRESYDTPNYPAIGIGYIAGYLKSHQVPVRVIDGKLARKTVKETIDDICEAKPEVVGFTSMTHEIVTASEIAAAVKSRCPETTTVLGGFHGSFLPERTLREFPSFDYLVVGEGEIAFLKFVRAIADGRDPSDIPGIASRRGDAIRINGRGEIPENLDDLGTPAWDLFPRATMYPIMSQRGCPFGCNFCSRPYGRSLRSRSASHVVAEIKRNITEFGCKEMHFYDETFTVRKNHVTDICDAIDQAGLSGKVRYWSYVHANTIDLPTAQKMKRAGFAEVGMGVESGNPEIMARMNKGVTLERIVEASRIFKEAGIKLGCYFIFGHPHETEQTIRDTIRFATKLNPYTVGFGLMTPYPGTEVWDLATKGEGGYKVIAVKWEDFNKQIGSSLELENLSRKTMERLHLEAYLTLYMRNFRIGDLTRVAWSNRGRIFFILRKLITGSYDNATASSSWLEGSAAPQVRSGTSLGIAEKSTKL